MASEPHDNPSPAEAQPARPAMPDATDAPTNPASGKPDPIIRIEGLTVRHGKVVALRDITMKFPEKRVTAIIGPAESGKTTLLRTLNRMIDLNPETRVQGHVYFRSRDILAPQVDVNDLRQSMGAVVGRPNPFPKSIFQNIVWAATVNGYQGDAAELVQSVLRTVHLWDEVKDRLAASALSLTPVQKQKLCIARALALYPDVLLMDEPCSSLDPVATAQIEDLITALKSEYTIIMATQNVQQAARVSDRTGFLLLGQLVEFKKTHKFFTRPRHPRTQDYITGRFG